ncbi:hypothetical protein [Photobacterium marinum]|nr:hypothetical protein [Photobacterium marinum]
MYTIFSLLKWVVLFYLVKIGRISESTFLKFKRLTLSMLTMAMLHVSMAVHLVESVDLVNNGTGDGYYLRRDISI